ncbi:hypothetical protein CG747_43210 [Streptomyces sp. CB02959]|uniref:DUF6415 family natural product biosynthesis protein n=1 Tax=Streptomyces sp. CB02959 TaxID=2020330 RepID=UPI000C27F87A|nr:DUF6415 family natural product biosynthesis protein [Streptomyces sp. CB02959]PJN32294.1 hypothetical protein CG747_43210 [Streptomyces sp. CB02959]
MAALTPPTSTRVEFLSLVEAVLAWEPQGPGVPDRDTVRDAVDQFTAHGRDLAAQLRALLGSCPTSSPQVACARATLREADWRLPLPPPLALPQAVLRAQNLGRLIEALHRAADLIQAEQTGATGRQAHPRACLPEDFT